MKKLLAKFMVLATVAGSLVSCNGGSSSSVYYEPDYHYNCYATYDSWGYYLYDECYWEYYNVAGDKVKSELDIVAEVSDIESLKLERMANHYAEKFSLSADESMKVSKNVKDITALEDRSESDLADFAQKLYGVNPTDVVSAVGKAQVGQNTELEALIESIDFKTSSANKKALIKELHGNALEANGIEL
jgi:hypothetical protein